MPTSALLELADIKDLLDEGLYSDAIPRLQKLKLAYPNNPDLVALEKQYNSK